MAEGTAARIRGTLARTPRGVWVAAGVVLALLLGTWAFGGFAPADARARPTWQAGEPHDHGQVTATIHDYAVTTEQGEALPDGATAWLVVRASVVPTHTETLDFARDLVALPPGVAIPLDDDASPESDRMIDLDDGRRSPLLHPGLPAEIAYLWPLADPDDAPRDGLTVDAIETQWIYSPSSDAWHWGGSAVAATMTIPYTDEVPDVLRGEE